MDLKEFVAETLTQIVGGVSEAQGRVTEMQAKVSPRLNGSPTHAVQHGYLSADGGAAQIVQFDVALTVKEGAGTKGGLGIVAGAVSLGTSGQSSSENSSVSRVKFSVPITLPNG